MSVRGHGRGVVVILSAKPFLFTVHRIRAKNGFLCHEHSIGALVALIFQPQIYAHIYERVERRCEDDLRGGSEQYRVTVGANEQRARRLRRKHAVDYGPATYPPFRRSKDDTVGMNDVVMVATIDKQRLADVGLLGPGDAACIS
jgi:hypothetical protein